MKTKRQILTWYDVNEWISYATNPGEYRQLVNLNYTQGQARANEVSWLIQLLKQNRVKFQDVGNIVVGNKTALQWLVEHDEPGFIKTGIMQGGGYVIRSKGQRREFGGTWLGAVNIFCFLMDGSIADCDVVGQRVRSITVNTTDNGKIQLLISALTNAGYYWTPSIRKNTSNCFFRYLSKGKFRWQESYEPALSVDNLVFNKNVKYDLPALSGISGKLKFKGRDLSYELVYPYEPFDPKPIVYCNGAVLKFDYLGGRRVCSVQPSWKLSNLESWYDISYLRYNLGLRCKLWAFRSQDLLHDDLSTIATNDDTQLDMDYTKDGTTIRDSERNPSVEELIETLSKNNLLYDPNKHQLTVAPKSSKPNLSNHSTQLINIGVTVRSTILQASNYNTDSTCWIAAPGHMIYDLCVQIRDVRNKHDSDLLYSLITEYRTLYKDGGYADRFQSPWLYNLCESLNEDLTLGYKKGVYYVLIRNTVLNCFLLDKEESKVKSFKQQHDYKRIHKLVFGCEPEYIMTLLSKDLYPCVYGAWFNFTDTLVTMSLGYTFDCYLEDMFEDDDPPDECPDLVKEYMAQNGYKACVYTWEELSRGKVALDLPLLCGPGGVNGYPGLFAISNARVSLSGDLVYYQEQDEVDLDIEKIMAADKGAVPFSSVNFLALNLYKWGEISYNQLDKIIKVYGGSGAEVLAEEDPIMQWINSKGALHIDFSNVKHAALAANPTSLDSIKRTGLVNKQWLNEYCAAELNCISPDYLNLYENGLLELTVTDIKILKLAAKMLQRTHLGVLDLIYRMINEARLVPQSSVLTVKTTECISEIISAIADNDSEQAVDIGVPGEIWATTKPAEDQYH